MGTKRCAQLVRKVRERSDNKDYGSNAGLSDTQITDYIVDGLEKLQSHISEQHSEAFGTSATIPLVANQEEYDLPDDMLEGAGLLLVEHRFDGTFYRKLHKITMAERSDGSTYDPSGYIRNGRKILLRPIPGRQSVDDLRIRYVKAWDRIGMRRGKINSVTSSSGEISRIVMYPKDYDTGDDFRDVDLKQADFDAVINEDYICIVDRDGNYLAKNVPMDSDTTFSTGISALNIQIPNHTLAAGETTPNGAYIVVGKDTSTHQLLLDRTMERYLIEFAVWRVKSQDASNEAYEQQGYLKSILNDILASYAVMDETVQFIPEI